MNNWDLSAVLLTAAVLVLAMPREDGFVIPERRDWFGWARRLLPKARRRREEEAGREADRYVTDLRTDRDQPYMTLRADQLPSASKIYRGPLISPPTDQKPPWKTSENPAWKSGANPVLRPENPPAGKPRRRAPGDPPTIVFEIMRPAIEGDLGSYLAHLPAYSEEDWSAGDFFVPRTSLDLGAPDHDGPPHDVQGHQGDKDDLAPLQPGADDMEHEEEPGGKKGPRY